MMPCRRDFALVPFAQRDRHVSPAGGNVVLWSNNEFGLITPMASVPQTGSSCHAAKKKPRIAEWWGRPDGSTGTVDCGVDDNEGCR